MTQNSINNSASSLKVDNLLLDGNTISSTDANGDIVLAPDGTGDVSITTAPVVPSGDRADSLGSATNSWDNVYADGLTFDDGTNVLGDYLGSASFTPGLAFGGGTTGITYSVQSGLYMRIGNLIWVQINIELSNKGSSTGACTITDLPFSIELVSPLNVRWNLINIAAANTYVSVVGSAASTNLNVQQIGDNTVVSSVTDAEVGNTSRFFVSGVYRTT